MLANVSIARKRVYLPFGCCADKGVVLPADVLTRCTCDLLGMRGARRRAWPSGMECHENWTGMSPSAAGCSTTAVTGHGTEGSAGRTRQREVACPPMWSKMVTAATISSGFPAVAVLFSKGCSYVVGCFVRRFVRLIGYRQITELPGYMRFPSNATAHTSERREKGWRWGGFWRVPRGRTPQVCAMARSVRAAARREWSPEEAARRDFEFLRLLSSDRGAQQVYFRRLAVEAALAARHHLPQPVPQVDAAVAVQAGAVLSCPS